MHEILKLPSALRVKVFFEAHAGVIEMCGFLQLKERDDVPFWARLISEIRPRTYLKWVSHLPKHVPHTRSTPQTASRGPTLLRPAAGGVG